MGDVTNWTQFVSVVGLPATLLIALSYMIYRAGVWFGNNVAKPVADAHIEFIQSSKETQEKQANALENQTALIRDLRDNQAKMCRWTPSHNGREG